MLTPSKLAEMLMKEKAYVHAHGEDGLSCVLKRRGHELCIIASWGEGWDHVSVHAMWEKQNLVPTWDEMCYVKSLFFEPEEVCTVLPAESAYVNVHPYVLHIWRPQGVSMPTPPKDFV
jgi:hypothetical protein